MQIVMKMEEKLLNYKHVSKLFTGSVLVGRKKIINQVRISHTGP